MVEIFYKNKEVLVTSDEMQGNDDLWWGCLSALHERKGGGFQPCTFSVVIGKFEI